MFREKERIGIIRNNKGFTLMELIIVMAILAVLVTLALLYYGNVGADAYRNALLTDLRTVGEAVTLYENNYGSLPVVESTPIDLQTVTTANVPAGMQIPATITGYTVDQTNTNFMNYIKKTAYLLKGVDSGDIRGAGKLYYVYSVTAANTGTATAGGAGSITLTGGEATNDYYNGCIVNITGGAGVGQTKTVTDYTDAGVATVNSSFSPVTSNTSVYSVLPPVKVGDLIFVQSATTPKLIIKDTSGAAIYKN
ncbi:MAG: type II secretion system protein [Ignavibacteriales bacterium]